MKNSKEFVAQVTSNYFCAGLVVRAGTIIKAAPILKYAKGKTFRWFLNYAATKGWRVNTRV